MNKKLLGELKIILKEEYKWEPTDQELLEFANSLVGYFEVLNDQVMR